VVEAHLEGLSFSVPICVITKFCHLYTSVDYLNKNVFSHPIDILKIFELLFHGCIFHVC
jgi:hypothetical protein